MKMLDEDDTDDAELDELAKHAQGVNSRRLLAVPAGLCTRLIIEHRTLQALVQRLRDRAQIHRGNLEANDPLFPNEAHRGAMVVLDLFADDLEGK